MGLFLTGCRASEWIGLMNDEVFPDAEVPYVRIEPNELRRLKNPQSRRVIPIHPYLIEAGFLEYARAMKANGELRLFPFAKQEHYNDRATGKRAPKSLSNCLIVRHFNRTVLQRADARANDGSIKCFRNTFEEEALKPYGLPRARKYPEHVSQNPVCEVGNGVWFGDIDEVWNLD